MKIKYKNKNVEKKCTKIKDAKKNFQEFGIDVLAKINIIAQMANFYDIMNYKPFNCHKLNGRFKDYWALDVKGRKSPWRFIVAPIDENEDIVKSDDGFYKTAKSLKVILIEEVSKHYEY